jgi:hypothetical protein
LLRRTTVTARTPVCPEQTLALKADQASQRRRGQQTKQRPDIGHLRAITGQGTIMEFYGRRKVVARRVRTEMPGADLVCAVQRQSRLFYSI